MRRILIAVGAGGALLAAVLAFSLLPTTTETAAKPRATPGTPAPEANDSAPALRAVSGSSNPPQSREAWIRERYGHDLNAEGEANVDSHEPTVKVVSVSRPAPQPSPELSPPLSAEAAKAHFDDETRRMVELFPDMKPFMDEMKADIEMTQREALFNAERDKIQRHAQQQ